MSTGYPSRRIGEHPAPLYPFLAAIYPVLALAAANPHELPPPGRLIAPVTVSLIFAALVYLLAGLVSRARGKRALLTLAAVALFAGYGLLADWGHGLAPRTENGDEIALPLTAALAILAVLGVRRLRGELAAAGRFLNRAAAVLLLMPLAGLGWSRLAVANTPPPTLPLDVAVHPERGAAGDPPPDIYLIILDKYTGSAALKRNYGFDNSAIEEALRARGFVVPRDSRSNYTYTPLSLASMLNWQYVRDFEGYAGREPEEHEVFALVERNRTWQFLRQRGYRFIFFPTAFPTTFRNRYADLQLPTPAETVTEFETVWLRSTPIVPLLRLRCAVTSCDRMRFPYVPEPADRVDWRFTTLESLADSAGPHFAFAHFLVPHEPYIYDAACEHRRPYWPLTDSGAEEEPMKAAYVAQIRCVNTKVLQLVDGLIRRSRVPPIILLQADHGHGRLGRDQPPFRLVPPDRADERAQVFAAYFLPDAPDTLLYDGVSAVNVIRRTLAFYFGADLPLLADETWWSGRVPPYGFTRLPKPAPSEHPGRNPAGTD